MSSDNEDYPEWFRRRRKRPSKDLFFGDIDRMFHEMEKMMAEEFKNFTENVPKNYVKERKLPDGRTVRELGPFVYGYSMKIGPDGKPEIRQFGNIKKSLKGPQVKNEREPLVDIVETDSEIRVVAELPGYRPVYDHVRGQRVAHVVYGSDERAAFPQARVINGRVAAQVGYNQRPIARPFDYAAGVVGSFRRFAVETRRFNQSTARFIVV